VRCWCSQQIVASVPVFLWYQRSINSLGLTCVSWKACKHKPVYCNMKCCWYTVDFALRVVLPFHSSCVAALDPCWVYSFEDFWFFMATQRQRHSDLQALHATLFVWHVCGQWAIPRSQPTQSKFGFGANLKPLDIKALSCSSSSTDNLFKIIFELLPTQRAFSRFEDVIFQRWVYLAFSGVSFHSRA